MKLIDADALYETVSGHVTTVSVCPTVDWAMGKTQFKKMCLEDIKNAPTVGGWISVSDRLPNEREDVLLMFPVNMAVGFLIGNEWFVNSGCNWFTAVDEVNGDELPTHWMPLPEPPKEEDDAKQ